MWCRRSRRRGACARMRLVGWGRGGETRVAYLGEGGEGEALAPAEAATDDDGGGEEARWRQARVGLLFVEK